MLTVYGYTIGDAEIKAANNVMVTGFSKKDVELALEDAGVPRSRSKSAADRIIRREAKRRTIKFDPEIGWIKLDGSEYTYTEEDRDLNRITQPLTAKEEAWVRKLRKVMAECPSDRFEAYCGGDCNFVLYDKNVFKTLEDATNATATDMVDPTECHNTDEDIVADINTPFHMVGLCL